MIKKILLVLTLVLTSAVSVCAEDYLEPNRYDTYKLVFQDVDYNYHEFNIDYNVAYHLHRIINTESLYRRIGDNEYINVELSENPCDVDDIVEEYLKYYEEDINALDRSVKQMINRFRVLLTNDTYILAEYGYIYGDCVIDFQGTSEPSKCYTFAFHLER